MKEISSNNKHIQLRSKNTILSSELNSSQAKVSNEIKPTSFFKQTVAILPQQTKLSEIDLS